MDYGNNTPIHCARNPHQRKIEGNVKAQRLSDAGLENSAKGDSEPDPELLKQFDSFYQTTKSLLVLFQIMGVMPIERSAKGITTFRYVTTTLKYYQVTGTAIVFHNLTLISYSLCIFSWVLGVAIMLAQYYLQPDMQLWHTFAYYHILAMLNSLCSLWFINCTAKGRVAEDLAQNLHNALESPDPASRLAEYRDLWVDLSHMMQQFGKAYSGMYGMYCILILLTTIVAFYGCLTEILDHGLSFKEAGLFLIAFYCMCLLYIICNEAHYTTARMGPEFRERLLSVNLMAVDSRTRQEVHMFLTAIDKNPPTMNLNQYADINRRLISSVSIALSRNTALVKFLIKNRVKISYPLSAQCGL
ncbi:invertebrate gustatory receptor [Holotrichia oblita]|uniref:Invertebrate gustatory receptor n=1 Tax=Holotrichia oblita TaxID=644536 RepID=A0ACB9TMA5_HOLOL|nr:invertebrate gustatory receptor [Holotrichia oblita]